MTMIVETITRDGIKSTDANLRRHERPHAGDVVFWRDGSRHDGTWGRIWEIEHGFAGPGEAHVCRELGSAFLGADYVSISGGPFVIVKVADLEPTLNMKLVRFWNWGDNLPGAGKGCDFWLQRPVFDYRGPSS